MSRPANTSTPRPSKSSLTIGAQGLAPARTEQAASLPTVAPFFETAPNPAAVRRMLLVFFDFAPSAEVGVLRWLSLSRFGADRGWAFDVVTVDPEFMGLLDESRLTRLPAGVRLFGFDGRPPAWYRGLVGAWRRAQAIATGRASQAGGPTMVGHLDAINIDRSVMTVDRASTWRKSFRSRVRFALADEFADRGAKLGLALARATRYDVVLSSGPPHAAHDAARRIATKTGLPFVMDMRDPWSDASAMPDDLH